jgi:uncharacterized protein with beta-barrel porin domain
MKRILFLLLLVAAMAAWCPSSFAARQTVVGSGALNDSTGVIDGVDMQNAVTIGTLTVGTQDIYTSNRLSNGIAADPLLLAVSADGDSRSDITFNGNSTVYGGIGGGNVFRNLVVTGSTVTFLGAVNATTFNVGTGTVNFNSASSNSAAMNFTDAGTISLAPNTTVIGRLTTNTNDTGTLSLGDGSRLQGAVGGPTTTFGLGAINVVGDGVTAYIGTADTGAVNAYEFFLGTNTLRIGGALTIADNSGVDGVINTTLASPAVYGKIIPAGAANLGSALTVNVTVPSTAYIPVGTPFNIVDATSGTNGSNVTVTVKDPTNPLYTFSPDPLYPPGTTTGKVTIKTTGIPMQASIVPPPGVSLPPAAPLAAPVVPVLLAIPNPSDDLISVLAPLNALTDPAAVVNAEAQLAPSTPALAAPLVTFQGIRQFQNLWLSRLDMCSEVSYPDEEKSNCRGNEPNNGWWLKGFGYYGNQDARDAFTGYDSRIIGTMIAYDVPIGLDTRAGLGFGYARSTIDGDTFDASTDFDTYQVTAYIGHEDRPWFVNGSASFGWNEYSSTRHIVFPGVDRTANANYSGQDYTAFASTGLHLSAEKFTITPLASLQYTRMHISDYSETDAGDIGLKVKSQNYDFLESGLGVKVERYFSDDSGRTSYVPEGHFNWFHEFYNPELEQTAEFRAAGSSSFTTPELKAADNTFNVGGGLSLLSCACSATTWSLEAVYDYYWTNDGYYANQVMMRLTSRF